MEILRKSVTVTARYWVLFQAQNGLRQPGNFERQGSFVVMTGLLFLYGLEDV